MEWITVISLIALGIGLIVVEVIFVPGTTIVGILGFGCAIFGIYLGFDYFDNTIGTVILIGAVLLGFGAVFYSFKSKAWERFSLKEENTGRYNDDFRVNLELNTEGMTISSIKPIGKAMFEDKIVEVRSNGGYIEENKKVKIIRIETNRIIVEPI